MQTAVNMIGSPGSLRLLVLTFASLGCVAPAAELDDGFGRLCDDQAVLSMDEYPAGSWQWPTPFTDSVFLGFGADVDYQAGCPHTGIDLLGLEGDYVVAAAPGFVTHIGPLWFNDSDRGRGSNAIILEHERGLYTVYSHNSSALVSSESCVAAGDIIATVGDEGFSGDPHLHFEVVVGVEFSGHWNRPFPTGCDHYRDPLSYLQIPDEE